MSVTVTMDSSPGCSVTVITQCVSPPGRRRLFYYIRLASESSKSSDDESVCSLQALETEYATDTPDTDTGSTDSDEADLNSSREYELATSSEGSGARMQYSSTDSETQRIITSSSVTLPLIELSRTESSHIEDTSPEEAPRIYLPRSFEMCKKCKGMGCYPLLKWCRKCYKEKRRHVPARVKKRRKKLSKSAEKGKRRKVDPQVSVVRLKSGHLKFSDGLQSEKALDDSTSSDEDDRSADPILRVKTDNNLIKMNGSSTIHTCTKGHSSSSLAEMQIPAMATPTTSTLDAGSSVSSVPGLSSSSTSTDSPLTQSSGIFSGPSTSKSAVSDSDKDDVPISTKNLCVICRTAPKDCAFLHQTVAHRCCCYSCAKNISKTSRRCPTCNRIATRIVRLYSS